MKAWSYCEKVSLHTEETYTRLGVTYMHISFIQREISIYIRKLFAYE